MTEKLAVKLEAGTLVYGDLKLAVSKAHVAATMEDRLDDVSRVNRSITHGQALQILLNAVAGHDDGEPVGKVAPNREGLMVRNIARECRA